MRRNVVLPMLCCSLLVSTIALGQDPAPKPPADAMPLDKSVGQAIELGKKALLESQQPNGSWPGFGKAPGGVQYPVGPTALATLALLEAGEGAQSPKVERALRWLATNKAVKTYELGLRCNVWLFANAQTKGKKGYFELLKHDADALVKAVGGKGDGSYTYDATGPGFAPAEAGDNSNSQYGLLGAWAAIRSNRYEVADEYWKKVMMHWAESQNRDGGWGYQKGGPSTATMTLAGVACLQICHDNLDSRSFIRCTNSVDLGAIERGLGWLDKNIPRELEDFAEGKSAPDANGDQSDLVASGDLYHFLWGLQRTGLLIGRKNFGDVDWYRAGTKLLLAKMQKVQIDAEGVPNGGGWTGGAGGTDVTTAYALLFLVRGRVPVLFNKLEFQSGTKGKPVLTDWNCRPRDLANLTNWINQQFETSLTWQIVNLKMPVKDWRDAPILYISGSREPTLTPPDIAKLRQYVLGGGTIFSCTECDDAGNGKFAQGIRKVYKQALPEYEMVEVPLDHPLYYVEHKLQGKPRFSMIANGTRALVIHTDEDLPKSWQLNRTGTASIDFQAAANLYMYVTDKGKLLHNRGGSDEPKKTDP